MEADEPSVRDVRSQDLDPRGPYLDWHALRIVDDIVFGNGKSFVANLVAHAARLSSALCLQQPQSIASSGSAWWYI